MKPYDQLEMPFEKGFDNKEKEKATDTKQSEADTEKCLVFNINHLEEINRRKLTEQILETTKSY